MHRLATVAAMAALAAGFPAAVSAQRFWTFTGTPLAYYSTVDGWWLAAALIAYSPVGFREQPEPHAAWVTLFGGASTQGSRTLQLDARAPAYWDGWRAALTLTLDRANRLGYFGLGNATTRVSDSVTPARPYFYQVGRTRGAARLTAQRRVVGPLRVLAGATFSRTDYRALPGETMYTRDLASGDVDATRVPFGDLVVRAGVVVDTRDHEVDPHAGLLAEALYARGDGYERVTGGARVYVRPFERLTLAARAAGERLSGNPPLAVQMLMESSERPFVALGGYHSLRGFYDGRFTGSGKLLGGIEARYALIWVPTIFELKVAGFLDTGRVFGPGEAFRLTTDALHTSGGAEIALRLTRNTLVVVGAGFSTEGWQLIFDTAWSY